jgi:hypothetical protein
MLGARDRDDCHPASFPTTVEAERSSHQAPISLGQIVSHSLVSPTVFLLVERVAVHSFQESVLKEGDRYRGQSGW